MVDTRNARAIRYQLGDLLRERIYAMAMGFSAQDDVDRLAHDPAFRIAIWNRSGDGVDFVADGAEMFVVEKVAAVEQ
jgi:hypothetical protein